MTKYIQTMNIQIRKHLNMEIISSLEEGFVSFSKKIKKGDEHIEMFNQ